MGTRVTMRDVAREAGVSPMTVSRALKQDGTVNAETRATVRDAADRLGYVYDTTAQAFRAQRSGFLAVILPSINNANFAATHRALTRAMAETDLQLLLGITNYRLEEEERLVRQLLARRPEALVLTGGNHTDVTRKLLTAVDVPILEIWDLPKAPIGHAVGFSNAKAMELIVTHLAQTGRRRLGFVGASGGSDSRGAERRSGAVDCARRLGLPEMVEIDAGVAPVSMTNGAGAAQDILPVLGALDALVCVSDPVAFGVIMGLQRLGVRVPEDVAVTGFGAFEIARIAQPKITTVDVGAARIGEEAGELVHKLLAQEGFSAGATNVPISPKLELGGSS